MKITYEASNERRSLLRRCLYIIQAAERLIERFEIPASIFLSLPMNTTININAALRWNRVIKVYELFWIFIHGYSTASFEILAFRVFPGFETSKFLALFRKFPLQRLSDIFFLYNFFVGYIHLHARCIDE